jgi:uncharacterized protein
MTRKAAVIGGGAAGLAAAYELRDDFDVTLFEAKNRYGGNAHTIDLSSHEGKRLAIDTGVVAFHRAIRPPLFDELDIVCRDMPTGVPAISIDCAGCGLRIGMPEDVGRDGLPVRPDSLPDATWVKFCEDYQRMIMLLLEGAPVTMTPVTMVESEGFSQYFVDHVVIPVIGAGFACTPPLSRQSSVIATFRVLANIKVMPGDTLKDVVTIEGGTRTLIERLAASVRTMRLATPVTAIERHDDGVSVSDHTGDVHRFDKAVIAIAADRALDALVNPTKLQQEVLGAIPYFRSEWLLHTDTRHPSRPSFIDYHMTDCGGDGAYINLAHNPVHGIAGPVSYISTLSMGAPPPSADRVLQSSWHDIVVITPETVVAQAKLAQINDGVVAFAGSYYGDGGHDNALASGINAARVLKGQRADCEIRDMSTGILTPWNVG